VPFAIEETLVAKNARAKRKSSTATTDFTAVRGFENHTNMKVALIIFRRANASSCERYSALHA
jgi:hypothetical protein